MLKKHSLLSQSIYSINKGAIEKNRTLDCSIGKTCICVVQVCKHDLEFRTLILASVVLVRKVKRMDEKAMLAFRNLLIDCGFTDEAVDALWKWYDASKKKGVASF
jgi:hypothetical protein